MPFPVICLIYVAGVALLFAELFVPGGVIGFLGTAVLVTSIVFAFRDHPPLFGVALSAISLVMIPSMIVWGLRRISLDASQNVEDGYTSVEEGLDELLGKEGETVTVLRPSGIAKIEGRRVDVTSENMAVEKNVAVKVVRVEGNQVIVRPIT